MASPPRPREGRPRLLLLYSRGTVSLELRAPAMRRRGLLLSTACASSLLGAVRGVPHATPVRRGGLRQGGQRRGERGVDGAGEVIGQRTGPVQVALRLDGVAHALGA